MSADELNQFDPVEEELAAYLDGELDAPARGRIERQLATDPALREKMRQSQQAWDALDLLPKTQTDEAFASSTMQMTVAIITRETKPVRTAVLNSPWLPWVKVGLGAFVALCVGFRMVKVKQLADQTKSLRDLPVAEKLEELTDAPSLEFLLRLKKENLFAAPSHDKS